MIRRRLMAPTLTISSELEVAPPNFLTLQSVEQPDIEAAPLTTTNWPGNVGIKTFVVSDYELMAEGVSRGDFVIVIDDGTSARSTDLLALRINGDAPIVRVIVRSGQMMHLFGRCGAAATVLPAADVEVLGRVVAVLRARLNCITAESQNGRVATNRD